MKLLSILIAITIGSWTFGQNLTFTLNGQVTNFDTGKKEAGCVVSIISGGKTVASSTTASNGKYGVQAKLPATGRFEVLFKKPGYAPKKVNFDFAQFDASEVEDGMPYAPVRELDMNIFTERAGIDFSFLNNEPVAKFSYDPGRMIPVLDQGAMAQTRDKIERLMAEANQKANEEAKKYNAAIKSADALYMQEKYLESKAKYQEALEVRADETHPKNRIKEIDAILAAKKKEEDARKQKEEAYKKAIAAANSLRDAKNWDQAIAKYKEALTIQDEQYPKDEIRKIEQTKAAEKKQQELENQYKTILAKADEAFQKKNWGAAEISYKEALKIKSSEAYPQEQIKKIEAAKAEEAKAEELDRNYQAAIKAGDVALSAKDYDLAEKEYKNALALKANEAYPKSKITEIEKLRKDLAEKAKQDAAFDEAIKAGNSAFNSSDWETAKTKYNEALKVRPGAAYPTEQLSKIQKQLDQEAELVAKQKAYEDKIKAADADFQNEAWDAAVTKYNEALALNPSESYPKTQIENIRSQQKKAANEAERETAYKNFIKAGDDLFTKGSFSEAITQFEKASALKPEETYPKEKINKCKEMLTEAAEAERKEKKINALFEEGQLLINGKNWDQAKSKYKEIQGLDPSNNLAQVKLDEIDRLIEKEEKAKTLEADFRRFVDEGDVLLKAEDWSGAKEKYGAALLLKEDKVVRDKYNKAESTLVKSEANALMKKRYDAAVGEADALLANEDLDGAKRKYKEALIFDEANPYPRNKIAAIEKRQAEEKKKEEEFTEHVEKGDNYMEEQKYVPAIKEYNEALEIKPEAKEVKDKADNAENLEKQRTEEADAQFEKIISVAEKKIKEEDFPKAIELLNRAKSFRPEDPRPDEMLAQVQKIQNINKRYRDAMSAAELEANKLKFDAAIGYYEKALQAKPNEEEPKKRIAELREEKNRRANEMAIESSYQQAYSKGMKSFQARDYETSLGHFQKALEIKAGDQASQDKIDEIKQILDQDAKRAMAAEEKKKAFDKFIAKADGHFEKQEWKEAKQVYQQALSIDFKSEYAKRQVEECVRMMQAETRAEADAQYRKIVDAADKKFAEETYDKAIDYYQRALKMRPNDPYPKRKLAEIDNILNPKVVESAKLADLGEAFEGDADLELAKADMAIRNDKAAAIEIEKDKAEQQMQMNDIFNQSSNLKAQEKLDYVTKEVRNDNEGFNKEQSALIEEAKQEVLLVNRGQEKRESDYKRIQTEGQVALQKTALDVEINGQNDDAERRQTAAQIEGYISDQQDAQSRYGQTDQMEKLGNKSTIENEVSTQEIRYAAESKTPGYNNQQVVSTQREVLNESAINKQSSDIASGNIIQAIDQLENRLMAEEMQRVENATDNKSTIVDLEGEALKASMELETDKTIGSRAKKREIEDVKDKVEAADARTRTQQELNKIEVDNIADEAYRVQEEASRKDQYDGTNAQLSVDATTKKMSELNQQSTLQQYQNKDQMAELRLEANTQLEDLQTNYDQKQLDKAKEVNQVVTSVQDKAISEKDRAVNNNEEIHDTENKVAYEARTMDQNARSQQLNNRENLNELENTIEEDSYRSTKKQEEIQDKLGEMDKQAQEANRDLGTKQTEKVRAQQDNINDVDTKPVKVLAKNSLGDEYPEGITEEKFAKRDSKGRLREVVTRRIIVREGHGDVYIKAQTSQGVTYTKNGNPITQHVWHKETQGPDLQRN